MTILGTTIGLTLLSHPFQIAMMALTAGYAVRDATRAVAFFFRRPRFYGASSLRVVTRTTRGATFHEAA